MDINQHYNLIKDLHNWSRDLKYKYGEIEVQTFHKYIDGEYWCGRSNEFKVDETNQLYDKFLKYLIGKELDKKLDLELHTKFEKEYIHVLVDYQVLEKTESYIIVRLIYNIGAIFSKREFVEKIQITTNFSPTDDNGDNEISIIVSEPYTDPKIKPSPSHVRATYHSVETVTYNKSTNILKWDMITTSDAKGHLPLWLQRKGVNKSISVDVPSFIKFIDKN